MTFATRLTKVRYRSEHFDERTGMCYHQAPPTARVVMHVRDAGQAKPHLEHNPLSLLGACDATPRRKLNDPGGLAGVWTRPTLKSRASGSISIVRWTSTARRLTFCSPSTGTQRRR